IAIMIFQVAQRWMNFAIANPARQVFFTVVSREEKYKAKNLIDVVIYRGSDALYGWVFDSLQALGLKLGAIALCAQPIAAGWLILPRALGAVQERRTGKDRRCPRVQSSKYTPAALWPQFRLSLIRRSGVILKMLIGIWTNLGMPIGLPLVAGLARLVGILAGLACLGVTAYLYLGHSYAFHPNGLSRI